jgi:hypothetical protein
VELVDKGRDHFRVHKMVLKTLEDLGFQLIAPYGQHVVTGGLVASARTVELPQGKLAVHEEPIGSPKQ